MKTVRELREERVKLVQRARQIIEKADEEKRGLNQEEQNNYDEAMKAVQDLGADIERREKLANLEAELAKETRSAIREGGNGGGNGGAGESDEEKRAKEYRAAFQSYLRSGLQNMAMHEVRALQAANDTLGGYLIPPQEFVNTLIKAVDNAVYMRQWATVHTLTTSDSMGAPSLDADPSDPTWTTELDTGTEDSSMAFGQRELEPQPLAKLIKVSRKLLRLTPSVEQLVIDRLSYKFGVTWEYAALLGSGAKQPLGVFVASNDGIDTSRDVSTGNTTTSIQMDGLKAAKYTLKGAYWPRARWLFHRDAVKQIAMLKDTTNQYLWQPGVRVGEPDRLLNFPYYMSEYAPNTFTTGQYVGVLGDFSYYWIADALNVEVQRLNELYARQHQVGFIGRLESDGMPVLAEAFVRVKLA